MTLQYRFVAIPRAMLNRPSTIVFLEAAAQNRPLHYVINPFESNASRPVTSRVRNRFICTDMICSYRPTTFWVRITQGIVDSSSNTALYSKYPVQTGVFGRATPIKRTMCTVKSEDKICWSCRKKIGEELFFCEICKIIQPPLTELSFFQVFGCPETYVLDLKNLTNRYRDLQSMIHPDKFSNSNEAEKHYSAEQSSLINKAYNTLLDPLSRAVYLLSIKDIEIGEGNTVEGKEFLMEIMEINEKLSDVKCMDDLDDIRTSNNDSIDDCIQRLTTAFQNGDLCAAKELTIKLKYYRNIMEIIKEKTMKLDN